jgi:energy-coupling factor transporter ATP-binding protein EcfA2
MPRTLRCATCLPLFAVDSRIRSGDTTDASCSAACRKAATLRQLAADGRTLVIATHDADFARACARVVIVMEAGQVVRTGVASAVLA